MKWFSRSSLSAAREKALSNFYLCPGLLLPRPSWCILLTMILFDAHIVPELAVEPITLAPLFLSSAFISFGVLLPFLAWWDAHSFLYLLWPIWRISHFSKEFLFNWGWWKLGYVCCMGLLIQDDLKRSVKLSLREKTEERALTRSHFLCYHCLTLCPSRNSLCVIGIMHAYVYRWVQTILTVCANI